MTSTTVRELLQHFKDDPKLQPLFSQLDELSKRVEVANAQNVTDPRVRSQPTARTGVGPMRASRSGSVLLTHLSASRGKRSITGPSDGSIKVEEASLPVPPLEPSGHLPSPPGSHPWEALQAPVNAACHQFGSPAAKATWKQWALTPDNVAVVVAVSWWAVAHVFQPDHHMAPAVKEHVFTFFARRYALDVLTYGGAGKDLYHNLWQSVVSTAAVEVLRGAFPRSGHKLDGQLEEFVRGQLVRWTAGVLPGDLHPSDHELVGKGPPAAHTHFHRHAQSCAQDQASSPVPGSLISTTSRAHLLSPTGKAPSQANGFSTQNGAGLWSQAGSEWVNIAAVVSGAVAGPTVSLLSLSHLPTHMTPTQGPHTSHSVQPVNSPSSGHHVELGATRSHGAHESTSGDMPLSAPSTASSTMRQPSDSDSQHKLPIATSPFAPYSDPSGNMLSSPYNEEHVVTSPVKRMVALSIIPISQGCISSPSPIKELEMGLDPKSPIKATGFAPQQASPIMAHMFELHALGSPGKNEAAHPGVMAHTFGQGQRSRRRPLDAAAPVASPGDQQGPGSAIMPTDEEEFTYASLAKQSCQRAADAVAKYEACKAGTRREVASLRRRWLAGRDAMQAQATDLCTGGAVKDMSDKLSNWLENDIDRMMRDQPVATVHVLHPLSSHGHNSKHITSSSSSYKKTADMSQRPFGTRQTATEAVLQAGGGASAGAATLGSADRGGRQPGYLNMTSATVAGAGCASASFLAATAATVGSGGPSLTRLLQPWSKMRSLETKIRNSLSQARHGSNDMAAHLAVKAKETEAQGQMPGMPGNGKHGAAWRPAPVEYTRGTLDIRLRHHVQKALKGVDMELYNG